MTTTATVTLTDCIDHLHPLPGPYLQRLVVEGPASTSEDYARLYGGTWELLGGWNPGHGTTIPQFLAANTWARCRFALNLSLVANVSELAPQEVVAVRFPLPVVTPERIEPPVFGGLTGGFGNYDDLATMKAAVGLAALRQKQENDTVVYDPRSAEGVMARLRALDCPPSLVVNEHDALIACWRLNARLEEKMSPGYRMTAEGMPVPSNANTSRFGILHHRLALVHGGDCNAAARPFMLLCDAPGIRRQDIRIGAKPGPIVTAEIWHEDTFTLEQMEQLATRKR